MFTEMTLRDGRTLEYAEFGDRSGTPVLYLHGTPGTGAEAGVVEDVAHRHHVRMIAPSRPGYGASTFVAPSLAVVAADAHELIEQLNLARVVAVVGISGGGAYALALAALRSDRIGPLAVHAGPGQYFEAEPQRESDGARRAFARLAEGDLEGCTRILFEGADLQLDPLRAVPERDFAAAVRATVPQERVWLDDHPVAAEAFFANYRRAIATNDGYVRDFISFAGPWDIDLSRITTHIRLVYADNDLSVGLATAEWLQERLADSRLTVVPGGHGDATFGAIEETFAQL
jgi:pimeloyl-ACP methyl ester carboxylesterase